MKDHLFGIYLLLVEDDPTSLEMYQTFLEEQGADLDVVTTAEDAMELLQERDYDAIISDLVLPGKSGIELLKYVCRLPLPMPVLLLTGHASVETAAEAVRLGAADYILKPVKSPEELAAPILKAVSHFQLQRQQADHDNQIRDSEQKHRELFQSSPDAIFIVDSANRLAAIPSNVNRAACHLLNMAKEEICKLSLYSFIHPEYRDRAKRELHHVCHGQNADFESKLIDSGQKCIDVHFRAHFVQIADNQHLTVWAEDIRVRRKLERRLTAISEYERQNFGHELHDVVCQNLTSIQVLSQSVLSGLDISEPSSKVDLLTINRLTRETNQKIRDMIQGLFPVELERLGLPSALQQLAFYTIQHWKTDCRLETNMETPLDRMAALNLYRICQEAVTNAVRHAHCTRIDIRLMQNDAELLLEIHDNGRGLPPDFRYSGGIGIDIMHHRAELCSAHLSISTSDSHGTTVSCRILTHDGLGMELSQTLLSTASQGGLSIPGNYHEQKDTSAAAMPQRNTDHDRR